MNTETRRHGEKPAYHRKGKYKDDPLEDEEMVPVEDQEDGGVLSDFEDEALDDADDDESSPPQGPSGRRR